MTYALGKPFPCRDCGTTVRWTVNQAGNKYLAQPKHWHGDEGGERIYWPSHYCTPNPEWQAARAEQIAQADARKAMKEAAKAAGVKAPEGRVTATGSVVKYEEREGWDGSPEWKMTVLADAGWSCWMTVPKSFLDTLLALDDAADMRIQFTATCQPSDRDDLFCFGKRPVVKVCA